jgi:hypothetical protein
MATKPQTQVSTLSDYSINDLQYPDDLSGPNYGGNKVIFFINVQKNSKFRRTPNAIEATDLPPDTLRKTTATQDTLPEQVGGVVINPTMQRLKAAIALYVPNDLSLSYGVNWSDEDLSGIVDTASELAQALQKDLGAGSNPNRAGVIETVISKAVATGLPLSGSLQKASQTTPANAKTEQLFKGVDFRTFSFNYTFAPRDEQEAQNALRIIRMFRHHMLPEYRNESTFLFMYPSQFEIKYYVGDEENPHLEKHYTAVLTNCNINYTPSGQFSTFANGMPTQIRMSLTFKELSLPTKESSPYDGPGV